MKRCFAISMATSGSMMTSYSPKRTDVSPARIKCIYLFCDKDAFVPFSEQNERLPGASA